jgi:hypothetical protein
MTQRGPLFAAYDSPGLRFVVSNNEYFVDEVDASYYPCGPAYRISQIANTSQIQGVSGTLFFPVAGTRRTADGGLLVCPRSKGPALPLNQRVTVMRPIFHI